MNNLTASEKYDVLLANLARFGPDKRAALHILIFPDLGTRPSVGTARSGKDRRIPRAY